MPFRIFVGYDKSEVVAIQETFDLTLLGAMAAGLPVVASDWDGYRYTMRDGIEAFLVPTLGGPFGVGIGLRLADLYALEVRPIKSVRVPWPGIPPCKWPGLP